MDSDALAFFSAASITDATQKSAVDTMVKSLKSNSLWTKFQALYPFVGGSSTSHKFNLKNPADTNAAFRLTFSGGWVHSSNGVTPNGTNGYANTFYTPSIDLLSADSSHLSFYSRTANNLTQRDLGVFISGGNPCFSIGTNVGPLLCTDNYRFDTHRINSSITNSQGLMINSRTSNTVYKAFRNSTQIGATNTTSTTGVLPTSYLYLGAANIYPFSETSYSNKQYAFASIGTGLSDTDISNLYTIVQTYQTTLGRNV